MAIKAGIIEGKPQFEPPANALEISNSRPAPVPDQAYVDVVDDTGEDSFDSVDEGEPMEFDETAPVLAHRRGILGGSPVHPSPTPAPRATQVAIDTERPFAGVGAAMDARKQVTIAVNIPIPGAKAPLTLKYLSPWYRRTPAAVVFAYKDGVADVDIPFGHHVTVQIDDGEAFPVVSMGATLRLDGAGYCLAYLIPVDQVPADDGHGS